jgi:hypothetical protein
MLTKIYASRSLTRTMGMHDPIGDPFGGVAYGEKNDPVTAAVVGGAGLLGSVMQADAARSAANTQADAQRAAQAQVLAAGAQGAQQYTPYTQLGQTGVNYLNTALPYLTQPFTNADLNANLAPNYAFQLQQGQGTTNAASNAAGGMLSGNALQGLQNYTQNFAANAYQNALNNYQAQQTNIYNRLSGIAGMGLQGATGAANALIGTGTNVANLTTGIGNSLAAGQIGQASAYGNALSNIGNLAALYGLGKGNTPTSGGAGFDYSTLVG